MLMYHRLSSPNLHQNPPLQSAQGYRFYDILTSQLPPLYLLERLDFEPISWRQMFMVIWANYKRGLFHIRFNQPSI